MVDWYEIFSNGIWLSGLGLVLAVVSFWDYNRREARIAVREAWPLLAKSRGAHVGGLLFCVGMGITSGSWLEKGLWALLALYTVYGLWARLRVGPGKSVLEATSPADTRVSSEPRHRSVGKKLSQWLVGTELLWLALFSPFFLFPAPARVWPLLVLPLLWIIRRLAHGHFVPPTPFDWAIYLLMLMVLVSMYATFDLSFSLGKIAGVLYGVAVYYAVVSWASNSRRFGWAVGAYLLAGLALAVLGLIGINWTNKFPALSHISSLLPSVIRGLPGTVGGLQSAEVGGTLLWVVPLQMSLLGWSVVRGSGIRWMRWLLPAGLLLMIAVSAGTLLLAQSRSALIGFALGFAMLLWLGFSRARPFFVLLVAVGIAGIIYIGPSRFAEKLVGTAGPGASAAQGIASLSDRAEIWSRALYGIEDFPFTGMGMNAFRKVMPLLYPLFSTSPDADLAHAHNELLQVALDLGLPGLVAYLAVCMIAVALIMLVWRSTSTAWMRAAVAGIGAGLLAHSVFGITDAVTLGAKPGVFFWALLALLVALWRQSAKSVSEEQHLQEDQLTGEIGEVPHC